MGNLLTNKKNNPSKVTAIDEAILELKIARKRLVDQKKRQELLAERAIATVQQLLRSKKNDRALIALRKRKLHEQQVLHIEGCILRIDEQLCSVETTTQQVSLVAALKTANVAIKEMQQQMKVEDIEKLMDESADAAQYLEEVQAVLGETLVGQDEGDLEAELNAMADKIHVAEMAELPLPVKNPADWQRKPEEVEPIDLPDVPSTSVEPARVLEPAIAIAVPATAAGSPPTVAEPDAAAIKPAVVTVESAEGEAGSTAVEAEPVITQAVPGASALPVEEDELDLPDAPTTIAVPAAPSKSAKATTQEEPLLA